MSNIRDTGNLNESLDLPVRGLAVSRCCIDQALLLEFFSKQIEVLVRIEGAFRLRRSGEVVLLNAEDPQSLGPALALLEQRVDTAQAQARGSLLLQFEDGTELEVDPDPDYEAWELTSTDGLRVVSTPGGGLGIWRGAASPPFGGTE